MRVPQNQSKWLISHLISDAVYGPSAIVYPHPLFGGQSVDGCQSGSPVALDLTEGSVDVRYQHHPNGLIGKKVGHDRLDRSGVVELETESFRGVGVVVDQAAYVHSGERVALVEPLLDNWRECFGHRIDRESEGDVYAFAVPFRVKVVA